MGRGLFEIFLSLAGCVHELISEVTRANLVAARARCKRRTVAQGGSLHAVDGLARDGLAKTNAQGHARLLGFTTPTLQAIATCMVRSPSNWVPADSQEVTSKQAEPECFPVRHGRQALHWEFGGPVS